MKRICAGLLAALLGVSSALAATTPNSLIAPQALNLGATNFIQGTDSAGTYKTIYTGGTNGSKCFALMLDSNDQAAAHQIVLRIVHSTVTYDIATYTTQIGLAGSTFGPTANLMSATNWPGLPTDVSGNPYIYLVSGDTLRATFATALTAGNSINIVAMCGDF